MQTQKNTTDTNLLSHFFNPYSTLKRGPFIGYLFLISILCLAYFIAMGFGLTVFSGALTIEKLVLMSYVYMTIWVVGLTLLGWIFLLTLIRRGNDAGIPIFLTVLVPFITIALCIIPSSIEAVSHPPKNRYAWWGLGILILHLGLEFIVLDFEITARGKTTIHQTFS